MIFFNLKRLANLLAVLLAFMPVGDVLAASSVQTISPSQAQNIIDKPVDLAINRNNLTPDATENINILVQAAGYTPGTALYGQLIYQFNVSYNNYRYSTINTSIITNLFNAYTSSVGSTSGMNTTPATVSAAMQKLMTFMAIVIVNKTLTMVPASLVLPLTNLPVVPTSNAVSLNDYVINTFVQELAAWLPIYEAANSGSVKNFDNKLLTAAAVQLGLIPATATQMQNVINQAPNCSAKFTIQQQINCGISWYQGLLNTITTNTATITSAIAALNNAVSSAQNAISGTNGYVATYTKQMNQATTVSAITTVYNNSVTAINAAYTDLVSSNGLIATQSNAVTGAQNTVAAAIKNLTTASPSTPLNAAQAAYNTATGAFSTAYKTATTEFPIDLPASLDNTSAQTYSTSTPGAAIVNLYNAYTTIVDPINNYNNSVQALNQAITSAKKVFNNHQAAGISNISSATSPAAVSTQLTTSVNQINSDYAANILAGTYSNAYANAIALENQLVNLSKTDSSLSELATAQAAVSGAIETVQTDYPQAAPGQPTIVFTIANSTGSGQYANSIPGQALAALNNAALATNMSNAITAATPTFNTDQNNGITTINSATTVAGVATALTTAIGQINTDYNSLFAVNNAYNVALANLNTMISAYTAAKIAVPTTLSTALSTASTNFPVLPSGKSFSVANSVPANTVDASNNGTLVATAGSYVGSIPGAAIAALNTAASAAIAQLAATYATNLNNAATTAKSTFTKDQSTGASNINKAITIAGITSALTNAISQINTDYNSLFAATSSYNIALTAANNVANFYTTAKIAVPKTLSTALSTAGTNFPVLPSGTGFSVANSVPANTADASNNGTLVATAGSYVGSIAGAAISALNTAANSAINTLQTQVVTNLTQAINAVQSTFTSDQNAGIININNATTASDAVSALTTSIAGINTDYTNVTSVSSSYGQALAALNSMISIYTKAQATVPAALSTASNTATASLPILPSGTTFSVANSVPVNTLDASNNGAVISAAGSYVNSIPGKAIAALNQAVNQSPSMIVQNLNNAVATATQPFTSYTASLSTAADINASSVGGLSGAITHINNLYTNAVAAGSAYGAAIDNAVTLENSLGGVGAAKVPKLLSAAIDAAQIAFPEAASGSSQISFTQANSTGSGSYVNSVPGQAIAKLAAIIAGNNQAETIGAGVSIALLVLLLGALGFDKWKAKQKTTPDENVEDAGNEIAEEITGNPTIDISTLQPLGDAAERITSDQAQPGDQKAVTDFLDNNDIWNSNLEGDLVTSVADQTGVQPDTLGDALQAASGEAAGATTAAGTVNAAGEIVPQLEAIQAAGVDPQSILQAAVDGASSTVSVVDGLNAGAELVANGTITPTTSAEDVNAYVTNRAIEDLSAIEINVDRSNLDRYAQVVDDLLLENQNAGIKAATDTAEKMLESVDNFLPDDLLTLIGTDGFPSGNGMNSLDQLELLERAIAKNPSVQRTAGEPINTQDIITVAQGLNNIDQALVEAGVKGSANISAGEDYIIETMAADEDKTMTIQEAIETIDVSGFELNDVLTAINDSNYITMASNGKTLTVVEKIQLLTDAVENNMNLVPGDTPGINQAVTDVESIVSAAFSPEMNITDNVDDFIKFVYETSRAGSGMSIADAITQVQKDLTVQGFTPDEVLTVITTPGFIANTDGTFADGLNLFRQIINQNPDYTINNLQDIINASVGQKIINTDQVYNSLGDLSGEMTLQQIQYNNMVTEAAIANGQTPSSMNNYTQAQLVQDTAQVDTLLQSASSLNYEPKDLLTMVENASSFLPTNFPSKPITASVKLISDVVTASAITKPAAGVLNSSFATQIKNATTIQYAIDQAPISTGNQSAYRSLVQEIQSTLTAPNNTIDDVITATNNSLETKGFNSLDDVLTTISAEGFPQGSLSVLQKIQLLQRTVSNYPNVEPGQINAAATNVNTIDQELLAAGVSEDNLKFGEAYVVEYVSNQTFSAELVKNAVSDLDVSGFSADQVLTTINSQGYISQDAGGKLLTIQDKIDLLIYVAKVEPNLAPGASGTINRSGINTAVEQMQSVVSAAKDISPNNMDAFIEVVYEAAKVSTDTNITDLTNTVISELTTHGFTPDTALTAIQNADFASSDMGLLDRLALFQSILNNNSNLNAQSTQQELNDAATIQNGIDEAAISSGNEITYKSMLSNIEGQLVQSDNMLGDAVQALNNSLKVGNLAPDDVLSIISSEDFVVTNVPNLSDAGFLNYKLSVLTNYVAKNQNVDINSSDIGALSANIQDYNAGIVSQYNSAPAVADAGSQVNSDMASDYAYNAMQVKMSFQNMSNLIKEDKIALLEAMKSQIEELESNIQGQAQQDEVNSLKEDYNNAVKQADQEDPELDLSSIVD